jgi:hypothetical protein
MVGSAGATERSDVMAVVHQFVNGLDSGDIKSTLSACSDQTSIIDEFPPYEWRGAGGCSKWADDYAKDAKANEITKGNITLGNPRRVDITAERAYVVVRASYSYRQRGKSVRETGSVLTLALQKAAAGWRITAWAWTGS